MQVIESATAPPVVIIGNGPTGMRAAREILARLPDKHLVIYGEEPHAPYDRVRLSSWLAGEIDWETLAQPLSDADAHVNTRFGYAIIEINRAEKWVMDSGGKRQEYEKLIIATGSQPHIPSIPGTELPGVYTFRNLDDANQLMARRVRSHHTVVVGGGLLGLEAARGMQRNNTHVTVVEHADRLLPSQLDLEASETLRELVEDLGIQVIIGSGIGEVFGHERVQGIRLSTGESITCDTVIIATGIRANIELARASGLAFGRGITVNDQMRSSDPDIYAIGECAEHRGQLYGFVAPGLEQAAVAASDIAGQTSHYHGSIIASRLKVVGTQVFSAGTVETDTSRDYGETHNYKNPENKSHRKILLRRRKIIGAIGIGEWPAVNRLQIAIAEQKFIWPWQLLRFKRTGELWPDNENQGVANWPASAMVCKCVGVNRGTISQCIQTGAKTSEEVSNRTGASTVCGSCKPLVVELLGSAEQPKPVKLSTPLIVFAVISMIAALAFLIGPNIPYANSVQSPWRWDILWRDGLLKQITGFSVLGLFTLGLLLSLRKRINKLQKLGSFDIWRFIHVLLGVAAVMALVAHTGFRLGNGLNFFLILSFALMLLAGAVSTGVISLEHRLTAALGRKLRKQSILTHIFLFWPVPVLLGWHIVKTYWF